jgi:hypothetical protein
MQRVWTAIAFMSGVRCQKTDDVRMSRFCTNLAMIAAITLTVTTGAANARGGEHGGSMAGPMMAGGTARQPAKVGRPQIMQTPGAVPRNTGSAAASLLFNSGIGIIPTPPPPLPTPPAEIAGRAPQPQLAPIAPLSPQLQTQFSTGGVVQPNMALARNLQNQAKISKSRRNTALVNG